jgi:hypothetical protein
VTCIGSTDSGCCLDPELLVELGGHMAFSFAPILATYHYVDAACWFVVHCVSPVVSVLCFLRRWW